MDLYCLVFPITIAQAVRVFAAPAGALLHYAVADDAVGLDDELEARRIASARRKEVIRRRQQPFHEDVRELRESRVGRPASYSRR